MGNEQGTIAAGATMSAAGTTMSRVFQPTAPPPLSTGDAARLLAQTEENLNKKLTYYEKQQGDLAREALKWKKENNKRRALDSMRRRKIIGGQLDYLFKYREQLFTYRMSLEQINTTVEVFGAIKASSKALATVQQMIPESKVDKIMDKAQEQLDFASELAKRISEPLVPINAESVDEDELEQELEALAAEENRVAASIVFPSPPANRLPIAAPPPFVPVPAAAVMTMPMAAAVAAAPVPVPAEADEFAELERSMLTAAPLSSAPRTTTTTAVVAPAT
jgi:charged multivesicular body protein 4